MTVPRGRTVCTLQHMATATVLAGAALLTAGCTPYAGGVLAATETVSVINTDKTVTDHVVSLVRGQDCSAVRASQGRPWCVEPYENDPVVPTLYCYRTLAKVTCYDRPSTNPGDKLVGVRPGGRLPTY